MAFTKGWVYNLDVENAHTHAGRLIAIALTFSTVAVIAIAVRLGIRFKLGRGTGPDDWAVTFSGLFGIAYSGIAIAQTRWGQALDPNLFPPENTEEFSKIQFAGGPTYILALLGFKLSLLFAYLRFISHQRLYRIIVYCVIALCTANQIVFCFVLTMACWPLAKQWDFTITTGHCINQVASYYGLAGTSLSLDVLIMLLPVPIVWNLSLNNMRQRLALLAVFSLGIFVTIIQVIRIFTIKNLKHYTDSEAIVSWSIVEINLGIVVACAPTYAPLFRGFIHKISIGSSDRRNRSKGYGYAADGTGNSQAINNRSRNLNSKGIDNTVTEYNFAMDDLRSKGRAHGTGTRIDADAESQEEILKMEDGIRVTTSITLNEDMTRMSESHGEVSEASSGLSSNKSRTKGHAVKGW